MEQFNEQHPHGGDWLREIVFGLNDGLVTTLVFIMVVSGAAPAHLLLVVLGEVLAGGVSMALGGYLSARTEEEVLDHRIAKLPAQAIENRGVQEKPLHRLGLAREYLFGEVVQHIAMTTAKGSQKR